MTKTSTRSRRPALVEPTATGTLVIRNNRGYYLGPQGAEHDPAFAFRFDTEADAIRWASWTASWTKSSIRIITVEAATYIHTEYRHEVRQG